VPIVLLLAIQMFQSARYLPGRQINTPQRGRHRRWSRLDAQGMATPGRVGNHSGMLLCNSWIRSTLYR